MEEVDHMRIIFVGCVESSYLELKLLLEHKKDVVGVVTKEASKFNADFGYKGER